MTAPPHRRALYRMPWLLVGMVGSALATAMMVRFESALSADITVAFFIPAIIYLADAVGTQSEAVAVRGLLLTGADLMPLLIGELGTGVVIGTTLGCLVFPLVWLIFGSIGLATTVAVAPLDLTLACDTQATTPMTRSVQPSRRASVVDVLRAYPTAMSPLVDASSKNSCRRRLDDRLRQIKAARRGGTKLFR